VTRDGRITAVQAELLADGGAYASTSAEVTKVATLFASGVALRARTIQAGPAMQMPVFVLLFLAPVYVPLDLLAGWVHAVAQVNPVTPIMETARAFISGSDADVGLAAGAGLGLVAVFAVWALRGLKRAEAAGS